MKTLPQPPHLTNYTWRPAARADAAAIFQLFLDIDAHDHRHWAGTLHDWEMEFDDPDLDSSRDTLIALTPAGQAAALAWVYSPRQIENKHRAYLWPDIHPDHRLPELTDFVLRWSEARARQILAERNDGRPRLLRGSAMRHDHYRIDLFQSHGFTPIRYFFTMRRDLAHAVAPVVLPAGLSMHPWSPEVDERTFAAFNDSFRDHWGFEPVKKEIWDLFFVGRSSFRPDLSFVVMAGEAVVGFSINFHSPEENARKGIDEGWIGDLGVVRAWRRQGVATALLNRSMQAFQAAGIAHAALGVDSENPTGALSVYENVGFAVIEQSMALGKT
ncbi:MAG: GNAT family N-acetyltransferase [Caldilineales bacterium]|nr:GNAT family N-acetyltransferase [Caldilineales bacterium]